MIEIILSLIGILLASLGYIIKIRKIQNNDIRHIHERINELAKDLSDLKERVARLEERVAKSEYKK